MAAAEYYNTGTRPSAAQHSSPYLATPQPHQIISNSSYVSQPPSQSQLPAQQPPPPYQPWDEESKPGVHFAPTPTQVQPSRPSFSNGQRPSTSNDQRLSFSNQQRPNPQTGNQPPFQARPSPPQQALQHPSISFGPPPIQRPYSNSHLRPANYVEGGYSSDPEPHRRRHEHREKGSSRDQRARSRDERGSRDKSRSTKADGFLGAAGGGLIGDLIFPGLGTIGGAALGWWGGKDYGHHRKWREEKRDRDQRRWDRKHNDGSSSRSRERYEGDRERKDHRRHSDY